MLLCDTAPGCSRPNTLSSQLCHTSTHAFSAGRAPCDYDNPAAAAASASAFAAAAAASAALPRTPHVCAQCFPLVHARHELARRREALLLARGEAPVDPPSRRRPPPAACACRERRRHGAIRRREEDRRHPDTHRTRIVMRRRSRRRRRSTRASSRPGRSTCHRRASRAAGCCARRPPARAHTLLDIHVVDAPRLAVGLARADVTPSAGTSSGEHRRLRIALVALLEGRRLPPDTARASRAAAKAAHSPGAARPCTCSRSSVADNEPVTVLAVEPVGPTP